MSIVNLTPHPIIISSPGSDSISIPSTGIARARETITVDDPIDGVPTSTVRYGLVEDLPDPWASPGTWYVVSPAVALAAAASSRRAYDLLVPGQQILVEASHEPGQIVGYTGLTRAQVRTEFTWRERDAFRAACVAAGGSSDVGAEYRGHGGRYPRRYANEGRVQLTATFWASPRRGPVLSLTEVPFHDPAACDAAYSFLASAGATCNDATDEEREAAKAALA